MNADLVELERLVEAGEADGVVDWCVTAGPAALKQVRPAITALVESARRLRAFPDWESNSRRMTAAAMVDLASAATVAQAATALDYPGIGPAPDLVVSLVTQLRPRWAPKLAQRLTANRWMADWPVAHRLVQRGLSDEPTDPRYLEGMVDHAVPIYSTVKDDPALLDHVWRFFESDRFGLLLGRRELAMNEHAKAMYAPNEVAWLDALPALTADGLIDRDQLHRRALGALLQDAPWQRLHWYGALIERLAPTLDEVAAASDAYLSLLRAACPQVVALGQAAAARLLDADRIRPDEFLECGDAPLFGKDKRTGLAQLKLLARFVTDPAWRDEVLSAVTTAFAHPQLDVQRAALKLAQSHGADASVVVRDQVNAAFEQLAPSIRPAVTSASERPLPEARPRWTPLPEAAAPDELDDDAFVHAVSAEVAQTGSTLMVDRIIEAALRISGYPHRQRHELLTPILDRVDHWGFVPRCVAVLDGGLARRFDGVPTFADYFLEEMLTAIATGIPRPYLALPTDGLGRIDDGVLAARLAEADRLPEAARPGPWERLIATLRSGAGRSLLTLDHMAIEPVPESGWTARGSGTISLSAVPAFAVHQWITMLPHQLRHYAARLPRFTGDAESLRALAAFTPIQMHLNVVASAWGLSLLPNHPDLLLAHLVPDLVEAMDVEPSAYNGALLPVVLGRFMRPGAPVGQLGPVVIAEGLMAKSATVRLTAVETLQATRMDGRLSVSALVGGVDSLRRVGVLKLTRLATAMMELSERDPVMARDLIVALLPSMSAAKDVHRLLTALADSIALTGPVPLPDCVRSAAAAKGSTKLKTEAQRLLALVS